MVDLEKEDQEEKEQNYYHSKSSSDFWFIMPWIALLMMISCNSCDETRRLKDNISANETKMDHLEWQIKDLQEDIRRK